MAFVPDAEEPVGGFVPDEEPKGRPLPANAGLAKFATGVAGIPVDTAENVINLGLAGFGTAATALGRPDLAPDLIRGSLGGSESLRRGLRATGEPGLSPDNPTPESPTGTTQYEFTARGGFLPQGAVPAAASMVGEAIGGQEWAAPAAMLPSAGKMAINELTAKSRATAQAQNLVRDRTLREAQEAGYVVPPSQVNPTFVGNRLEGIAGKAATGQDAALRNQQVTNTLARKAIGLPENTPLTEQTLNARRNVLAEPYRQISAMSPVAKQALEKLRDARSQAQAYWRHWDMQGVPESQRMAKKLDMDAQILERVLESQAVRYGKPGLVQDLRAARANIAKTYDVERAVNFGDGNIDARILGRALDRGRPLTGELAVAAKFAEAFPNAARPQANVPPPGVSKIEGSLATLLGAGGAATMGPAGLALAAIPLASHPTRAGLLSKTGQRALARPSYEPYQIENNLQALTRAAILEEEAQKKAQGQQ